MAISRPAFPERKASLTHRRAEGPSFSGMERSTRCAWSARVTTSTTGRRVAWASSSAWMSMGSSFWAMARKTQHKSPLKLPS